jgi:hypothetical protein
MDNFQFNCYFINIQEELSLKVIGRFQCRYYQCCVNGMIMRGRESGVGSIAYHSTVVEGIAPNYVLFSPDCPEDRDCFHVWFEFRTYGLVLLGGLKPQSWAGVRIQYSATPPRYGTLSVP